jgi:hypothetical protein
LHFDKPITYPNGLRVNIQDGLPHHFPGPKVEVSVYDTVDRHFVTKTLIEKARLDADEPHDGRFVYIPAEQLPAALAWTAKWRRPGKNIL